MKNNKPESYTSFLFDVLKRYDHYIAGTGPKRKLGAWHRFKIRNNRPAQKSIAYLLDNSVLRSV